MTYRLIIGDCIEVMRQAKAESVHAIVCDPPYGLQFMGKTWDSPAKMLGQATGLGGGFNNVPAGVHRPDMAKCDGELFGQWCEAWATEALRVLKPGGHLLAFGGTRMWHWLAVGIERAGFEVRDSIAWHYSSGMPKSKDQGKEARRLLCRKIGNAEPAELISRPVRLRSSAGSGSSVVALARMLNHDLAALLILDGGAEDLSAPTATSWSTLEAVDTSWSTASSWNVKWEDLCEVASRSITSTTTDLTTNHPICARSTSPSIHPSITPDVTSLLGQKFLALDAEDPSRGSMLSSEIIHVLTATELATWRQSEDLDGWGTCVKPAFEPIVVARKRFKGPTWKNINEHGVGGLHVDACRVGDERMVNPPGMAGWNAYRHEGDYQATDEVQATVSEGRFPANAMLEEGVAEEMTRYFFVAKPSTAERRAGLPDGMRNPHITIKPIALMRELVRLVAPAGAQILDPFMGSGTTGIAALQEGMKFIGIEIDPEYAETAFLRIEHWTKEEA